MENEINGYKWAMCTTMEIIGARPKDCLGLLFKHIFKLYQAHFLAMGPYKHV